MNSNDNPPPGNSTSSFQVQLDRLVDNELNEAERRQLLAECDERTDGWRQCALALLESQAWRTELGAIVRPAVSAAPEPALATVAQQAARPRRRWVRPASRQVNGDWATPWGMQWRNSPWVLAAMVLIAFAIGWLARPASETSPDLDVDANFAGAPRANDDPSRTSIALPDAIADATSAEPALPETVTLMMNCGADGETRQIELPVLASTVENLEALERSQPVVSAEVQAALLRIGHRVHEHRELMPLTLEDGRQMVVPVDKLEFVPIEPPAYQ